MVAPEQESISLKTLDRINLRLAPALFRAIDDARGRRPGNVSRNTWITEAIQEKLSREAVANDPPRLLSSGSGHG